MVPNNAYPASIARDGKASLRHMLPRHPHISRSGTSVTSYLLDAFGPRQIRPCDFRVLIFGQTTLCRSARNAEHAIQCVQIV
jgi:hypothetical protein